MCAGEGGCTTASWYTGVARHIVKHSGHLHTVVVILHTALSLAISINKELYPVFVLLMINDVHN